MQFKGGPTFDEKTTSENSTVEVAGQNVMITEDSKELDDIDKTISDILHSSTLENVTRYFFFCLFFNRVY